MYILRRTGNPANDIVDIINSNRTSHKLHRLNDSPGLGCMALQYVELCKGNCTADGVANCKPTEDDFTEVFAPNCGVELPTFGAITGHIVGCQSKYLEPSLAYAHVLVKDNTSLSILRNRSHTEVGVGMVGDHKGAFFWGILFSNGQTNSTFVLEDNGKAPKQLIIFCEGIPIPRSSEREPPLNEIPVFIHKKKGNCRMHYYYHRCISFERDANQRVLEFASMPKKYRRGPSPYHDGDTEHMHRHSDEDHHTDMNINITESLLISGSEVVNRAKQKKSRNINVQRFSIVVP
ncbi:hypothetical protein Tsubulata_036553 [Turnera subulata]|uniref:Uncharacterized protein n=1 Tax=Turnera subulata TaxID=218843 RepID=A0A9Q0F875_9ROSI|nr:hypothetical protein Tsubulata_036553 [Turnera subulata]